jgi:uncharacterized protein (DUF2235 family)
MALFLDSGIDPALTRDTVSSIGIAREISFPETTTGMQHVCMLRHALALDERRVKFLPEYVNGGLGRLPNDSSSAHEFINPMLSRNHDEWAIC